jgi:hypothetical protein
MACLLTPLSLYSLLLSSLVAILSLSVVVPLSLFSYTFRSVQAFFFNLLLVAADGAASFSCRLGRFLVVLPLGSTVTGWTLASVASDKGLPGICCSGTFGVKSIGGGLLCTITDMTCIAR